MPHLRWMPYALLSLVAACAAGSREVEERSLSPSEKRAIAAAVDSATHSYLDALAARDANRTMAHFADDPEFLAYFDGTPMSHDAVSKAFRETFAGSSAIDIEPVTIHVTVLGPDAAIAGFSFRQAYTDTAKKVSRLRGTASWTWRRQGNGWTIIHGDAVHLPDTTRSSR